MVAYDTLSHQSKDFIAQVSSLTEPTSYDAASKDKNCVHAMQQELQVLAHNYTWDVVAFPPGKTPIGCKWVYKVKLKSDGTWERCKAILVAKGYNRKHGIDYEETFSLWLRWQQLGMSLLWHLLMAGLCTN